MAQLITGIFRDRTSAESAVESLENRPSTYRAEQYSIRTARCGTTDCDGGGGGTWRTIGALAGAGIDKKLAEQDDRELSASGIMIGVATRDGNYSRIRAILNNDSSASTAARP